MVIREPGWNAAKEIPKSEEKERPKKHRQGGEIGVIPEDDEEDFAPIPEVKLPAPKIVVKPGRKKELRHVGVRLPEDLVQKLEREAAVSGKNLTRVIEKALMNAFADTCPTCGQVIAG